MNQNCLSLVLYHNHVLLQQPNHCPAVGQKPDIVQICALHFDQTLISRTLCMQYYKVNVYVSSEFKIKKKNQRDHFRILEDNEERRDLSHPVHADNCLIQPDGSCLCQFPAYIARDYRYLYLFSLTLKKVKYLNFGVVFQFGIKTTSMYNPDSKVCDYIFGFFFSLVLAITCLRTNF